jgi:hypothetical protein
MGLPVRRVAYALRKLGYERTSGILAQSYPHRSEQWRHELLEAARLRNREKVMRKVRA